MEHFSLIVGRPALIPKYGYGYLASAMGYAEAENAQELLEAFPEKLKMHSIPCDVLHLSSGYTVDSRTKQRNVFTWNRY
jgi:alpha-glucosidase